ncbi:hypothetical protein IQ266_09405 [filamentous cyanobacterium LEGE 11480]|uniref:Uncharacterized protein n=1 Tax=Romeriopsis navalis LEGE 11480 TaxID=2777977 RepID=A0A928Z3E4_9CYAN|nr:hypothetical protein [Romeriopsis navalis]MBE9029942.1 hypothetical protein [Romeriopsis navalis LEGE 11480]
METPHNRPYLPPVTRTPRSIGPTSPTRYAQEGGVRKHPMIILTGIWLVLLVLGWLSMSEIISPGADVPLPKTTIAQVEKDQSSSLGVLGAIAGGCAVLSLLLAQKIDRR